jgi:heme-degrading monooxygenase HmoA
MTNHSQRPKKQKPGKKGKKQYKVRNWHEYNEALVNRGRITFWITEEAMKNWEEQKKDKKDGKKRKPGKPKLFSDTAIETTLVVGQVFHLPLRQTEGFVASILSMFQVSLKTPDFSTLSIRGRNMPVCIAARPMSSQSIHIVVDSTGAKVYGEGEWKVRQHGWTKRRRWKKLHVGVDEATGDILLGEVTDCSVSDGDMLEPLLASLPEETVVQQVSADGAYDQRKCYDALRSRSVHRVAIPPKRNARIWRHGNSKDERLARDENLRRIRSVGRKTWKQEANYHRRSLAETTMFRLKTIFTDRVSSRTDTRQRTELLLRCKALNRMTTLGMPKTEVVG